MHIWPSKKVRDFFSVSHLNFLERHSREMQREKQLQKQASQRLLDKEVEGGSVSVSPRGGVPWKELVYVCCCLDFCLGYPDEE